MAKRKKFKKRQKLKAFVKRLKTRLKSLKVGKKICVGVVFLTFTCFDGRVKDAIAMEQSDDLEINFMEKQLSTLQYHPVNRNGTETDTTTNYKIKNDTLSFYLNWQHVSTVVQDNPTIHLIMKILTELSEETLRPYSPLTKKSLDSKPSLRWQEVNSIVLNSQTLTRLVNTLRKLSDSKEYGRQHFSLTNLNLSPTHLNENSQKFLRRKSDLTLRHRFMSKDEIWLERFLEDRENEKLYPGTLFEDRLKAYFHREVYPKWPLRGRQEKIFFIESDFESYRQKYLKERYSWRTIGDLLEQDTKNLEKQNKK